MSKSKSNYGYKKSRKQAKRVAKKTRKQSKRVRRIRVAKKYCDPALLHVAIVLPEHLPSDDEFLDKLFQGVLNEPSTSVLDTMTAAELNELNKEVDALLACND
jgi:hypothetical protein